MAPSSFSLLLRHYHLHRHLLSPLSKHFSVSSDSPKPSSLSARLSFVFDKIDEIESDRAEKDEALHRIRAWRESKKKPNQTSIAGGANLTNVEDENVELGFSGDEGTSNFGGNEGIKKEVGLGLGLMKKEIELAHPWPEWIALMERLVQQNYFDHRRKDEDEMIQGLGSIDVSKFADEQGFDFTRDWKTVQAAVVNFAKDRFDIFRSLSRQDIRTFVGYGCPSTDKKVVFSAKLLRKHAHLDEGDVCSSCSMRTNCERAYLVTNKEDEARTIDVMRVLLTYGFNPINGLVANKSLLKQKSVKQVIRKLLHEVVRLSAVPIDPNLPPPVIKKRPPKVKQPPPPPKRRVGRDDIEMKKGDWLCPKCNFMNFAKNSICLQCDAKRPKRQLLPGEWECPQCNFLNYRRNMSCFNCENKRPPDEFTENQMQGRQQRPGTRAERVPDREQLSNAWNFDFDDDESDGADVAAFEYADARTMNEDHHLDSLPEDSTFNRPQDNRFRANRASRFQDEESERPVQTKQSVGFDDFDDEDDDVDSYELDNQNRTQRQEASSLRFSDVENEGYSDDGDDDIPGFSGAKSRSYPKSSKSLHQKRSLSNSRDDDMDFDSDEDLPVHPKWRSSHVADSGHRNKASRGPSRRMSFDSDGDDKLVFGSDDDINEDVNPRQRRGSYYDSDEMDFRQGEKSNQNSRQNRFEGRQGVNFVKGSNFDDDFDRSSRGSRGNQRGTFDNARGRQSMSGGSRGSHRVKFDNARGWQSMDGDSRGSRRDKYDNGDSRGSHRGKFDNARGRQSMDGNSHGSLRGKIDNGDSRGSQRGKYDNARGRPSIRGDSRSSQRGGKYDSERGRHGMSDFSESRQPRGGRGGRRSYESDNTWSDYDRPLRQR